MSPEAGTKHPRLRLCSSFPQLLPASRKLRASRAAARRPELSAPRTAQGSRGRWDTQPVLRGVCAPGLGAKASARGRSPGWPHPHKGQLEPPCKHRLDFVCKISFPQAGAAAAPGTNSPEGPPNDTERSREPSPWGQRRPGPPQLHSTWGLFPGAPHICPSIQGFCSNEMLLQEGK